MSYWFWYAPLKTLLIFAFHSFSLPLHIFSPLLRSTCGWSWFLIYTASTRSHSSSPPPPRLVLNHIYITIYISFGFWKINYLRPKQLKKGILKCNIDCPIQSCPQVPLVSSYIRGLAWYDWHDRNLSARRSNVSFKPHTAIVLVWWGGNSHLSTYTSALLSVVIGIPKTAYQVLSINTNLVLRVLGHPIYC